MLFESMVKQLLKKSQIHQNKFVVESIKKVTMSQSMYPIVSSTLEITISTMIWVRKLVLLKRMKRMKLIRQLITHQRMKQLQSLNWLVSSRQVNLQPVRLVDVMKKLKFKNSSTVTQVSRRELPTQIRVMIWEKLMTRLVWQRKKPILHNCQTRQRSLPILLITTSIT